MSEFWFLENIAVFFFQLKTWKSKKDKIDNKSDEGTETQMEIPVSDFGSEGR